MTKIMAYGLAAILGLFSGNLFAEGNAYQIELIVFSQNMPNTEVFDQTTSKIKWPATLTELSAYKKADNMTLNDSLAALSRDSAYRPVLHISWIQAVENGGLSVPVHIQSADGKLNGYLQIQHGQSLQLIIDVEYAPSGDSAGETTNSVGETFDVEPIIFRLNEKRPIKLDEVYYLDHPKFGVIAKISAL